MGKVKAKPYVSILLKALIEASKVDNDIRAFKDGMFSKVPLDMAIEKLNEREDSMKLLIEKIVEFYNRAKGDGKI